MNQFFSRSYVNDIDWVLKNCPVNGKLYDRNVDMVLKNSLSGIFCISNFYAYIITLVITKFRSRAFTGLKIDREIRPMNVSDGLSGIASAYTKES